MIDSAYARAAVASLEKWSNMTTEEAQKFVATHSKDEVENRTGAQVSVEAGFDLLVDVFRTKGIEINEEQKKSY